MPALTFKALACPRLGQASAASGRGRLATTTWRDFRPKTGSAVQFGKVDVGSLTLAIKAFFKALGNREFSKRLSEFMSGSAQPALPAPAPQEKLQDRAPPAPKPARSDALSLLAVLQREARLIDFLQESLTDYSDEQIGAAVREVHRGCAAALARMFDVAPIAPEAEGASTAAPAGFDASRYKLTGNVHGAAPYRGTLRHRGWEARRCDLPAWTGSPAALNVLAPIEIEV